MNSSGTHNEGPAPATPEFAPGDYTDGRSPLDWQTKYPPEARRRIRFEALYIGVMFFVFAAAVFYCLANSSEVPPSPSGSPKDNYLVGCLLAWFGGTVGGSLFTIKWLYHSVAKRIWHEDRRLWRVFAPHVSGAVAFFTVILASSGLLKVFDESLINSPSRVLGFSFLIGYFSDKALAKLAETADTLFGATRS